MSCSKLHSRPFSDSLDDPRLARLTLRDQIDLAVDASASATRPPPAPCRGFQIFNLSNPVLDHRAEINQFLNGRKIRVISQPRLEEDRLLVAIGMVLQG